MIRIDLNALEDDVKMVFFEKTELVSFDTNEVVVELGKVCKYLFLIEKGMLRNYYYDQKGNDITHWFASEDMIVTAPPSFFRQEPSTFRIEATEPTTVYAISYEKLNKEFEKSIHLERFFRELVTEIMITLGQKIISLQTKNAEYRYDELLRTHPDIFQRAKLGHIAGYLGMRQQSLSRIRALKRVKS